MRKWGGGLGVILLAVACGGRSQRAADGPGEPSGATSDVPGASGAWGSNDGVRGPDVLPDGGAPSDGGASSEAGAPDTQYQSLIHSGTRRCDSDDYCFGLSCYAPADLGPTVCVAPCQSDANCGPSEVCLSAPELEATCYARCKSPEDYYYGFSCFDFSGEGELVCFPAPWTASRDKLGY